ALGYLALLQVTRCKSGTNSRHYRKNGYVPNPNPNPNPNQTGLFMFKLKAQSSSCSRNRWE
ncbi:hypothetical protein, partial [Pseudomonas sp. fls2-241-R2A-110]|uniref:hypothetical protein n=1 Tax=Pseudomonas sp. fls2-241-R2A-110 TaxID=3040311 RepID=UPI00255510F9